MVDCAFQLPNDPQLGSCCCYLSGACNHMCALAHPLFHIRTKSTIKIKKKHTHTNCLLDTLYLFFTFALSRSLTLQMNFKRKRRKTQIESYVKTLHDRDIAMTVKSGQRRMRPNTWKYEISEIQMRFIIATSPSKERDRLLECVKIERQRKWSQNKSGLFFSIFSACWRFPCADRNSVEITEHFDFFTNNKNKIKFHKKKRIKIKMKTHTETHRINTHAIIIVLVEIGVK